MNESVIKKMCVGLKADMPNIIVWRSVAETGMLSSLSVCLKCAKRYTTKAAESIASQELNIGRLF
jgi:hypothetical protein